MYCSNCGTKNNDTLQYCQNCGSPLNSNAPSAIEQEIAASNSRQGVIRFLRAFQAHVAPQAQNHALLNDQCAQMKATEQQRATFEKSAKSPIPLIAGVVFVALGIGLITSFAAYFRAHIDDAPVIENPTLVDYINNFAALGVLVSPIILGALLIAVGVIRLLRAPKTRANLDSRYAQAKTAAQAAANAIQSNYDSFPNHQLVAFKYANPWLLDTLARIVADGKADTLTQAIQYFENEQYRQEMVGIASANLYVTQEILERTKAIQRQLAYVGIASTIGTVGAWSK